MCPSKGGRGLCSLDGMTFEMNRMLVIHDSRLAFLHSCLGITIVIYIVFIQGMLQHNYAQFEVASAVVQSWASALAVVPVQNSSSESYPFCSSNAAWNWGGNLKPWELTAALNAVWGPNISCIPYNPNRHSIVGEGAFTVLTSQHAAQEREELLIFSRERAAAVSANQALHIELLNASVWYLKSSV